MQRERRRVCVCVMLVVGCMYLCVYEALLCCCPLHNALPDDSTHIVSPAAVCCLLRSVLESLLQHLVAERRIRIQFDQLAASAPRTRRKHETIFSLYSYTSYLVCWHQIYTHVRTHYRMHPLFTDRADRAHFA